MKKILILSIVLSVMSGSVYAAKYKVNTSGTIKNSSGQIVSPISNTVNQNYNYNQPATTTVQPVVQQTYDYNQYATFTPPNQQTQQYNYQTPLPASSTIQTINNYTIMQSGNYIASNQVNSIPVNTIEFVMDYSGSMSNWIQIAKRSMAAILAQVPSTINVGFRVFGHDAQGQNPNKNATLREVKKIIKKGNKLKVVTEKSCIGTTSGACSATAQVSPIQPVNINNLLSGMNSVNLGGATPLVYALDRTVNQDFANLDKTSPKKIVLITDGGENCGGNPCAFARKLMSTRTDVHIDVVLVSSSSMSLSCLSNTTGGRYYTVNNLADFASTINQSITSEPVIQPEAREQKYEFIEN